TRSGRPRPKFETEQIMSFASVIISELFLHHHSQIAFAFSRVDYWNLFMSGSCLVSKVRLGSHQAATPIYAIGPKVDFSRHAIQGILPQVGTGKEASGRRRGSLPSHRRSKVMMHKMKGLAAIATVAIMAGAPVMAADYVNDEASLEALKTMGEP